jgi:hypothetical protein
MFRLAHRHASAALEQDRVARDVIRQPCQAFELLAALALGVRVIVTTCWTILEEVAIAALPLIRGCKRRLGRRGSFDHRHHLGDDQGDGATRGIVQVIPVTVSKTEGDSSR